MSHSPNSPKLILIAGPYRSNTNDDPLLIHANYRRMNEVAGSKTFGGTVLNASFHPVGRRLVECVYAVMRIGGPSIGADEMVSLARSAGKPVYLSTAEIDFSTI